MPDNPACYGGNMWESNPPKRLFTALTGFEDRRAHQRPICSHPTRGIIAYTGGKCKLFHGFGKCSPGAEYRIKALNGYGGRPGKKPSATAAGIF